VRVCVRVEHGTHSDAIITNSASLTLLVTTAAATQTASQITKVKALN